jgi:hypothetical protein
MRRTQLLRALAPATFRARRRARSSNEGIYRSDNRILLGLVPGSLVLPQEASCSIETYAPCLLPGPEET